MSMGIGPDRLCSSQAKCGGPPMIGRDFSRKVFQELPNGLALMDVGIFD